MFKLLLTVYLVTIANKLAVEGGSVFSQECYPNGTILVTNPDSGSYSNVYAVENEGSSAAVECSVSSSGSISIITGCSQKILTDCKRKLFHQDSDEDEPKAKKPRTSTPKVKNPPPPGRPLPGIPDESTMRSLLEEAKKGDESITVHFSNRDPSADDGAFGGNVIETYEIECAELQSVGVDRTVVNNLGATLEKTTQAAVTPSFVISSALREHSSLEANEVFGAKVGTPLYWTIDVPSEYSALPSCYAYSGSSNSGSPNKQLVSDGCVNDASLIQDSDFSSIYDLVPLISRYYVTLYVFQFYNSEDVYFECSVKVCPSGSSACDFNCVSRKRSIDSSDMDEGEVFRTGQLLHIVRENSALTTTGSMWIIIGAIILTMRT